MNELERCTICGLIPHTDYTVKISCKPLWEGYWSEEVEKIFKTKDDGMILSFI